MLRVVVLGTGTGVGKTFVSVALARALHRLYERPILAVKPVETGRAEGRAPFADAALLESVSVGIRVPSPHPLYGLNRAVSPYLASREQGVYIDLSNVSNWLDKDRTTLPYNTIQLVETAGGVFSPLNENCTNLDLAVQLGPARWLLVAPDALGVLHDVAATLLAMAARARLPDLVVLSAARPPDDSTGSNAAELERLGVATCAAVITRDDPAGAETLAHAVVSGTIPDSPAPGSLRG